MVTGVPQLVLAATAAWSALYLLLRHAIGQTPEWTVRVVTVGHALLITALAALDWAYLTPWDIQRLGEPNTRYEEGVLSVTLGYFIFDFLWVLRFQTEGPTMYFHHITSILCVSFILGSGISAAESLLSVSLLEGTNPCLQARWFLRTHGYQGTLIHSLTEYIFMITFLLLRICYGTYLTMNIVKSKKPHIIFKLGTLGLYIVSLVFVYQMFSYIVKKYFRKDKPKED